MLSGRYPSDEFAELRPRVTWDRVGHTLTTREGALRVAVANAGTIPDRGLYGVFLAGAKPGTGRVGELDEEMVFESRVGETFLLGASTWRIEEITHDRVPVSPAPGEPGKMPFWKGDPAGRPRELGLCDRPSSHASCARSRRDRRSTGSSGSTISIAAPPRTSCSTSPTRSPPPARPRRPHDRRRAVPRRARRLARVRALAARRQGPDPVVPRRRRALPGELGIDVETMWSDDGFVVRVPDMDEPPDPALFVPSPDEVESLVVQQLGRARLFAAKFREVAGRALLLPRRRPGARRRCGSSASAPRICWRSPRRFGSFPAVLETFRECLRDVFDMPALVDTLHAWRAATSAWWPWTRRCRRRLPPRCSSATSRRSSTTATRRWPNAARRR